MSVFVLEVGKRYRNTRTGREFLVGDVNALGGVCEDCQDPDLTGDMVWPGDTGRGGWWTDLEEIV